MTAPRPTSRDASPATTRCPVCQARFRGTSICSRCGADLAPLMRLTIRAHLARQAARRALLACEYRRARGLAAGAQLLHATPAGRRLELLAEWLSRDQSPYR